MSSWLHHLLLELIRGGAKKDLSAAQGHPDIDRRSSREAAQRLGADPPTITWLTRR